MKPGGAELRVSVASIGGFHNNPLDFKHGFKRGRPDTRPPLHNYVQV